MADAMSGEKMKEVFIYPLSRAERIIVRVATIVAIVLAITCIGSMLAVSIAASGS